MSKLHRRTSISHTKIGGANKPDDVERKLFSHIPDLVIFDKNYGKVPHILKFDGVLLFADVSGFTALTERYTMSSEKGTDALTVTLNDYIGKIVQFILQAGGDILKFAGDAILAVWKVKERSDLKHAISQATKCSLAIQDKCDNQATDVGVKLRVKIAISAGKIFATFVGNQECRHFVMAGRPVTEVNDAEKYCEAGLVVLSPNAMELSDKENIISEALSERFGLARHLRREPKKEWNEYVDIPQGLKFTKNAEKSIRICLGIRSDTTRELVVRKYISPVVQRKLDDDQPLKYLSEMRQCSILFINLAFDLSPRDRLFHEKQCQNMQSSFSIVYTNIMDRQGSLNKIFMFDKGCTFLVIFGLPGDKHEQEPAHALQAAWNINKELHETIPTLTLSSMGVTTGPVFCGVIGHTERHEYTVIGQKVNLAARLMMHYPNHVSCDFETYNNSKLSKDMFTRLPHRAMKGVGNVVVYDYTEGERKSAGTTTVVEPKYPIIGRFEETELFMTELRELKVSQSLGKERRVIVFEGEAGYGKTRMMQEIQWRAGSEGVRVIAFTLSINDLNSPYFAMKTLVELLLGIEGCKDQNIREQSLLQAVDKEDEDQLCLLNDIVMVKFPMSSKIEQMDSENRTRVLHRILVHMVQKITANQFVLFALDDAQNVDSDSWKFITTLSKDSRALCVLTMRPFSPDKPPCQSAKQVLYHPKTMYVKLGGLMNEHLTPLACQFLQVERIPLELEMILVQRSYGVPLWCEQLVKEMNTAGILLIVPLNDRHLLNSDKKHGESQHKFNLSRHRPSVGVADRSLIERRKESQFETTVARQGSETFSKANLNQSDKEKDMSPNKEVDEQTHVENDEDQQNSYQSGRLKKNKHSMKSWTDRIKWRNNSKTDMGNFLNQSNEEISQESSETKIKIQTQTSSVAMECVVKPGFDLSKFPVPASIRGMALTRLDRMKPFEQLVVKCAAVVGGNVSIQMLQSIVPGYQEEKFRRAVFQLMRSRVFECASADVSERDLNRKKSIQLGGMSPCITCACHKVSTFGGDDVMNKDEQVAKRCEQYKFRNSLVQETAYQLWLKDQRRSLHEACAHYLEGKINEVLITGSTDEVVTKQFRLSRNSEAKNDEKETESSMALPTIDLTSEENSAPVDQDGKLNIEKEKETCSTMLGVPDAGSRRLSRCSVIGRMNIDGVGARKSFSRPLVLQAENMPADYTLHTNNENQVNHVRFQIENQENKGIEEIENVQEMLNPLSEAIGSAEQSRKMSLGPMWSQSVGLSATYERVINNTEEQAKRLSALTLQISRTPYEIQDTLSLLYSQLVHHCQKASNTEKTIEYYLKAAESSIATMHLAPALQYLQDVNKIVDNLDKGLDIISNFTEDDDLNLDDTKVLSVGRDTQAKIQTLLGQVLFQQDQLDEALPHFLKALKILHCKLPTNRIIIWIQTMYEKHVQNLHIKQPSKYIGSASSKLANKYVEQVRCLSYVWQILLNQSNFPNKMQLSKLVAYLQLNRAEAADDDLQELITAYTYMMQFHHIAGDISQSAYYENRATARCLDLPKKLTSPDLYITGHLQLVSCSVRLCYGKLSHATTAGYRAYNIADTLGDTHIKLIVLPLLAQIHMMTAKGRACNEVLNLLQSISKQDFDEIGISIYYSLSFDLVLDAGYMLESALSCVDYLQTTESLDIGDVPRFYIRTSMAVWCYRRDEVFKGRAWLELSTKIVPEYFDNFMSAKSFTRLVEARLLALRKSQESYGLNDKETKNAHRNCSSSINQLEKLCKQFPVFYPRLFHFTSFFNILTGNIQKATELVDKSIKMARTCGNVIDEKWALHSQQIWFSSEQREDSDYWVKCSTELPKWEKAIKQDRVGWNFTLKPVDSYLISN
uniref:adenylate cyclase type 10-like n=1 Tax=Ciona intestinalis TaxID=7719 RepID=UPI0002B8D9C7|nr:adenylate cyclase type 10-like [Ciona intestinalis]|eukprot:XP_002121896.2 adenylate cyclase type 10-like [Ciona intestinalis]